MKIALDFDDTITRDPELWSEFIELAKRRLHEVTIVTYRFAEGDNQDIIDYANAHNMNYIFTSGKQKVNVFKADVWIDDDPVTIPESDDLYSMYEGCIVNGE